MAVQDLLGADISYGVDMPIISSEDHEEPAEDKEDKEAPKEEDKKEDKEEKKDSDEKKEDESKNDDKKDLTTESLYKTRLLNNKKIDILRDFKDVLLARGTICRGDVVSLESMLNEPVITSDIAAGKFPEERMRMNVQETATILTTKINALHKPLSVSEVICDLKDLRSKVMSYAQAIAKLHTKKDSLIDILGHSDVAYLYQEQQLVSSGDSNFLSLLNENNEWLHHVALLRTGNNRDADVLYSTIHDIVLRINDGEVCKDNILTPTISLMLNPDENLEHTTDMLTLKRVNDFLTMSDSISAKLDTFADAIAEDINLLQQGACDATIYQREVWGDTVYAEYPICKYILEDKASEVVIAALSHLTSDVSKAAELSSEELSVMDDVFFS